MDKEIIEGNRLIAEFMGATEQVEQIKVSSIGTAKAPMGKMYFRSDQKFPDYMYTCKIEDLKYHSSWSWLMPVVQKLPEKNNYHFLDESAQSIISRLKDALFFVDIDKSWKAVVDYLKWYNTKPKQQ